MKTTSTTTRTNRFVLSCALAITTMLTASKLATAQTNVPDDYNEIYGHTFNAGIGPGYFGAHLLRSPFFSFNYEFDLLHNLTIAPFVGFSSYRSNAQLYSNGYYYYRGTIVPVGAKATYYFDELLDVPYRWDFYMAGSAGYTFTHKKWDAGYSGRLGSIPGIKEIFLDLHVGTEYHINNKVGLFIDLSTNVSVIGVALH